MQHVIGYMVGYPSPPPHLCPLCTSDLGTYPPLLTSGGHHWRTVWTCSLERVPPPTYWHLVVATETCMFGKQPVCILPLLFVTSHKWNLGRGNVFTPVWQSFCSQGDRVLCMMLLPVWLPDPMFLPGRSLSLAPCSFQGSLSRGGSH